jgi:glyoxylase I family protein
MDRRTLLLGASTLATLGAAEVKPSRERVLGIGGLFFRSRDPKALADWYQRHLGIDPTPTDYQHAVWRQAAGPTVFAPFPMDTHYFGSPQQAWMVNFRVRDLDAMAAQLRASEIDVKIDPETYPNGRFARLHDPEGNPIELWEPVGGDADKK